MNFQNWWNEHYNKIAPISFTLKHDLKDKWIRIHSLPESKRYANNSGEMLEILHRQKILFDDILQDKIWIVWAKNEFIEYDNILFEGAPFYTTIIDSIEYKILSFKAEWNFEQYKDLLIKLADDKIKSILFINICTAEILAPYDGGVDIISSHCDKIKSKYSKWLPTNEMGL